MLPSYLGTPLILSGVSLDVGVVAGNTIVLFFSSFLSSFPSPPSSCKLGVYNRWLNDARLLIGLSPFIWFPLHWPPQTSFPSFLSCPFCLHVPSSSPFSSLARTSARTLACAHARTCVLHQTRFRCPRFVTMRYGSLVVPLHLASLHRQRHTLFCSSRLAHRSSSLLRSHVLRMNPFLGRMGVPCP